MAQQPSRSTMILVVGALAAGAWVISSMSANSPSANPTQTTPTASVSASISVSPIEPKIVTVEELKSLTSNLSYPVYWNGEMADTQIELTVLSNGSVYVRYLPLDETVGTEKPYFTVATYYDPVAYGRVQALAQEEGAKAVQFEGGAIAVTKSATDQNSYFAFENVPLLINVFSPDAAAGWDLIASGKITILE